MKIDKLQVVKAIAPIATGSARTGTYISLKNVIKCLVVVSFAGATTDTCAITLEKATAVAPSGSTAITNTVPIWSNLDCSASNTLVARTAAVSYTTDAAATNKIVVFQVDSVSLGDTYDCITVKTGVSHSTNIVSAIYLLEMRSSGADVIAD